MKEALDILLLLFLPFHCDWSKYSSINKSSHDINGETRKKLIHIDIWMKSISFQFLQDSYQSKEYMNWYVTIPSNSTGFFFLYCVVLQYIYVCRSSWKYDIY